ncbi:hypothetical protein GCM10010218_07540 [Streptomyces mashuensis]|uniref:Uncharacterized protein n=1 Tax=Streptomyces mashuensis TaxID=33904 RepID=A0A919E8L0_9ACTN|nr:hypothetical protein GCM10010218_07540 [Streptomyces mashuensis]
MARLRAHTPARPWTGELRKSGRNLMVLPNALVIRWGRAPSATRGGRIPHEWLLANAKGGMLISERYRQEASHKRHPHRTWG